MNIHISFDHCFLSRWEQRLYEFCFVWIQKDVDEKRGAICTHWNACFKTFQTKSTKMSTRNSSILMTSSLENLFLETECSFTDFLRLWHTLHMHPWWYPSSGAMNMRQVPYIWGPCSKDISASYYTQGVNGGEFACCNDLCVLSV